MATMGEIQTRNRIKIAVFAYAYEFKNDSLVSDAEFDELAKEVKAGLDIGTGNDKLDEFFAKEFVTDSGMWIHRHPELHKVCDMYHTIWKDEV